MNGINIKEDEVEKENIPDDLNSLAYSSYRIPDLKRRKIFSLILFTIVILTFSLDFFFSWLDLTYSLLILIPISIYLYFLKSNTKIEQSDVIQNIGEHIAHSIGYYSTALTFKGILLTPVWTVIVYDHNSPPKQRSIVEFDANSGHLINNVFSELL